MITILHQDEGTCALCQKDKPGVETTSDQYGSAFFDWACLKKITRLARPKPERPTPMFDRLPDPPAEISVNGGR